MMHRRQPTWFQLQTQHIQKYTYIFSFTGSICTFKYNHFMEPGVERQKVASHYLVFPTYHLTSLPTNLFAYILTYLLLPTYHFISLPTSYFPPTILYLYLPTYFLWIISYLLTYPSTYQASWNLPINYLSYLPT